MLYVPKQKYLNNTTIFVTLEPCSMCASAISEAHISTLYFGAYDNKNGGEIQFNNPLAQFTDYTIIPRDYYIGNCNEYSVYPIKNLLLLFPSYLSHRIGDYKGKTPRYSLAFNVVPIGEYGQSDSTYNTEWI